MHRRSGIRSGAKVSLRVLVDSDLASEAKSEWTGPIKLSHPRLVLDIDLKLQEVSCTLTVVCTIALIIIVKDLRQTGNSLGSGTCESEHCFVRGDR